MSLDCHVTGYLQHMQQHDSLAEALCLQHDARYGDHMISGTQPPARPHNVVYLLLKLEEIRELGYALVHIHMHMYTCIYMYICVHVCTLYVYIYMYMYMHIHVSLQCLKIFLAENTDQIVFLILCPSSSASSPSSFSWAADVPW